MDKDKGWGQSCLDVECVAMQAKRKVLRYA